ncbi:MAG TPA: cellulose synthase complex periplasmic endoglucanase BcsZ [Candidatus Binatia bacterium]|nr:cellulose synthase complex periplasmic endoglucanase BcsZ [Candidatus Binatia bacterium]
MTLPVRAAAAAALFACAAANASAWPDWDAYAGRFVQADGRVVDLSFDQKSTSEGQSYALFFALVANDRARFDRILKWTADNLAGGQLGARLPAWHWGKRDDGSWGVKDDGPAADGDIWIAYALLQAARLWHEPAYAATADRILAQVREKEVVSAGKAGTLMLPGPWGFALENGRWRYDPSYLPGFVFAAFAARDDKGPWREIWQSYLKLAPKIFRAGVAPDLCIVDSDGRIARDPERPDFGYDAIRVYLWAGMSDEGQPLRPLLKPITDIVREHDGPPERVTPAGEVKADFSPIGFSGAMLPYLASIGEKDLLAQQHSRVKRSRLKSRVLGNAAYYDESLNLFGLGFVEGHYRFGKDGQLEPKWAA